MSGFAMSFKLPLQPSISVYYGVNSKLNLSSSVERKQIDKSKFKVILAAKMELEYKMM